MIDPRMTPIKQAGNVIIESDQSDIAVTVLCKQADHRSIAAAIGLAVIPT